MSDSADSRRQILGLLTKGIEFSEQAIPKRILLTIIEALQDAWSLVLRECPVVTGTDRPEPEANAALEAALARLLHDPAAPRTFRDVLVSVSRGSESLSFDGSSLEKRPDLSLFLAGQRIPLRAECKLIDAARGRTVAMYCEKGLRRFVVGEYAWERREALMIAYVRDGSSLDPLLVEHLEASAKRGDPYGVLVLPDTVASGSRDLAVSRHQRAFMLALDTPIPAGPIDLWHLWLRP